MKRKNARRGRRRDEGGNDAKKVETSTVTIEAPPKVAFDDMLALRLSRVERDVARHAWW
jgi:hypothetical protein